MNALETPQFQDTKLKPKLSNVWISVAGGAANHTNCKDMIVTAHRDHLQFKLLRLEFGVVRFGVMVRLRLMAPQG